jgi:hypothetical protein
LNTGTRMFFSNFEPYDLENSIWNECVRF